MRVYSSRTLSKKAIVCKRCAMLSTVTPSNSDNIVSCMSESVSASTDAVASSIISILEPRKIALAMHSSCLCPTLKFDPFSDTNFNDNNGRIETSSVASSFYAHRLCTSLIIFFLRILEVEDGIDRSDWSDFLNFLEEEEDKGELPVEE